MLATVPPIDKLVEVPPPDRRAAGRGENKSIRLIVQVRVHVRTNLRKDHGRNRYDAFPGARLGGTEHHPLAALLGECLPHPYGADHCIDVTALERSHLTPPKATEGRQENERAIALWNLCSEVEHPIDRECGSFGGLRPPESDTGSSV